MQTIRNIVARWRLRRRSRPWEPSIRRADHQANWLIFAILAWCAAWVGIEYDLTDPVRVFDPYSGCYVAGAVLTVLASCYAAARIARRVDTFTRFATAFVAGLIVAIAVMTTGVGLSRDLHTAHAAANLPFLLAVGAVVTLGVAVVVAKRIFTLGRLRALLLALVPLTALFLYGLTPRIPIWYTRPALDAARERLPTVNVETVYYSQYDLMRKALNRLKAQRPGIADLYFVGFAGEASQDVFLKEVRSVGRLFDGRFDTASRSLLLINNRATADDVALASGSNLWFALSEIGKIMDPDEDILFLFLTSHGTKGELAVRFWPLGLNDLTAPELRDMLDRASIKWRVIVISACYSGSFIDALHSDHTLIITAAAKDRTSFGCSNQADFTYFGRAYFDEALRHTLSFTEAFGMASQTIAARETAEGLIPSRPQIDIGAAIRPKLEALRDRLLRLGERRRRQEASARRGKPTAP